MLILPLPTPLLHPGDDLAAALCAEGIVRAGDIVVVSSKAVATCAGDGYDLAAMQPSGDAEEWARRTGRSPAFCEAVLRETARLHGNALGACPAAIHTEVFPDGMPRGGILTLNAGLDESNVPGGRAVGWPADSAASARALRLALQSRLGDVRIGVLITDSCCMPWRLGVIAFGLAVSGFPAMRSEIGTADLYGKPLHVTVEAVADQLAVAGNAVMGNAAQSVPAAIIRDHAVPLTDDEGWVEGMPAERDLFRELFR